MRALLDVNVLIALMDATHTFHGRAHEWWQVHAVEGWASCPLVENGAVRIMTHPGYSASRRFRPEEILSCLAKFVEATNHEFWHDSISLRDPRLFASDRIHRSQAVTDLYLLALACERGGQLVTFDRGIPLSAVPLAQPGNLCVL